MKTKSYFTFRVDVWDSAANSILEHIAGIDDFEVAEDRLNIRRRNSPHVFLRQGQ